MAPEAATLVRPAHLWIPERASSAGQDAIDLAESCGLHLDGEQQLAVDAILSEKPDGTWAALEAAIVAPRQNIKTFTFEALGLAKLFLFGSPMIVWSAHLFPTAQESFRHFDQIIEANPHLSRRIKTISRGNGEEAFETVRGHRLRFQARSKSGGRGLSGSDVFLDEAFALQPGHLGALMPILSAQPNPQLLYGSSAGMAESAVLRAVRDRGRAGGDPSLVYLEWCAPGSWAKPGCRRRDCTHKFGVQGCVLDNEEYWKLANLALGRRIKYSFVRTERRSLPTAEFARERMGWWDDAGGEKPFELDAWNALADASSAIGPGKSPVFALDASPGLRSASIGAAGRRADSRMHLEVIEYRDGVDWIVPRAKALKVKHRARIVLARNSPIAAKLGDLQAAGVDPYLMNEQEMAAACGWLQSSVDAKPPTSAHLGDQILAVALEGAVKRDVGDGNFTWSRVKSVDICPLVAITEAAWAVATLPPLGAAFAARA